MLKKFFLGQLFALLVLYCKYVVDHEIAALVNTHRAWGGSTGAIYIFGTLPLALLKEFFQVDFSRFVFLENLIVYFWSLFFVYSIYGIQKISQERKTKKK